MCLVNDHTAPLDLLQLRAVSKDHLKGGDNHLELEDPRERVTLGKQKPEFEMAPGWKHLLSDSISVRI